MLGWQLPSSLGWEIAHSSHGRYVQQSQSFRTFLYCAKKGSSPAIGGVPLGFVEAPLLAPPKASGGATSDTSCWSGSTNFTSFGGYFLSYPSTRGGEFIGPNEMIFGGLLDTFVSIQPVFSLLSFFMSLSFLNFKWWGSDNVFLSYPPTRYDESIGQDGMWF